MTQSSPTVEGLDTLDMSHFEATDSLLLRPGKLLASLRDFYFRASDGLVALPAAGYDYGGNWTISTGGTFTRWTHS